MNQTKSIGLLLTGFLSLPFVIPSPTQASVIAIASGGSGTLTGSFENPITLPTSVVTGIGTDFINWGTPIPGSFTNQLSFEAFNFTNQPKGEDFVAGYLYYRNGSVDLTSTINGVDLVLNTSSSDLDFTQTLTLPIAIGTTPNFRIDPIADADYIYFPDYPDRGSFRVLEGESTYVEILARFNSLEFVGFGNVGNPSKGFVTSSIELDPFPSVPEPTATWALVGLGLVKISLGFNKRKKT